MKTKTKTTYYKEHSKQRAKERYGIEINKEVRKGIIKDIQSNKGHFLKRQSNRVSHFAVVVDGQACIVVYDKIRHTIITFLPKEAIKRYKSKTENVK